MRKFELYKVVDHPEKGLIVERDSEGFYAIAKLARTKDNVFSSIEEIEIAIGYKLEFLEEKFIADE